MADVMMRLVRDDDEQEVTLVDNEGTNAFILPRKNKVNKTKPVEHSKQELPSKISSKKRKRLERYIENRYKAEEKSRLIRSLGSKRVDTSSLASSKNLGNFKSCQQRLNRLKADSKPREEATKEDTKFAESADLENDRIFGRHTHKADRLETQKTDRLETQKADRLEGVERHDHTLNRAKSFKLWAMGNDRPQLLDKDEKIFPSKKASLSKTNAGYVKQTEASITSHVVDKKAIYIHVDRNAAVQRQRLELPILSDEQQIMELIQNNDCVIITGPTGSGKTTQVPQFLYEAGYGTVSSRSGKIAITQPRRVAAMSTAARVAFELGPDHGAKVGYQIRFQTTVKTDTVIKYMTDGILLRELADDFMLSNYSVVIIDESHERSINTDILIGVLSRVVRLRKDSEVQPLKLLIMSATLRVSDFTDNKSLFATAPPVYNVESRQYPVTIHFEKRTEMSDYVKAAFDKIYKIHQKLPEGGILAFLTGQDEINRLCTMLREDTDTRRYGNQGNTIVKLKPEEISLELEDYDFVTPVLEDNDEDTAINTQSEVNKSRNRTSQPMRRLHVLPLFSLLPSKEQMRVFEPVPTGSRLCVVATNVAETSITIPDIRYVVDCGRAKARIYDKATGIQRFGITWVSKASAEQRAGRAGRTGPGHVYRLYSSAVYERDFPQNSQPELLQMPIEGKQDLVDGERILTYLGALDLKGRITPFGSSMAMLPVSPRFAKMLLIGHQYDSLAYIIVIVAGLSVGDPILTRSEEAQQKMLNLLDSQSDVLRLLTAICAYEYEQDKDKFCHQYGLHCKRMKEISQLRQQLSNILRDQFRKKLPNSLQLTPPSNTQIKAVKQIVAAVYIDKIAVRADLTDEDKTVPKGPAHKAPYQVLASSQRITAYIHPSSVIVESRISPPPEYLVYHTLEAASQSESIRIRPLTNISFRQIERLRDSASDVSKNILEDDIRRLLY